MSEILSAARPDFFGKDSFTPFIAQVEDVDDPKRSGRVKVRCVGWHPFNRQGSGEDSLSTEDLPWARVGMPATHAQQSRIGGKHGLLVGCWVMGFFMDGDEAQDPFILCTFGHTARASDKDNRKDEAGDTGTLPDGVPGYTKTLQGSQVQNVSRKTKQEQGQSGFGDPADTAGDALTIDSKDNPCGDLESEASNRRMNKEFSNDGQGANPESQIFGTGVSDGRCGSIKHAQVDIQRTMQETMSTDGGRFSYGDKVWEAVTGNAINLNANMASAALKIAGYMKQPLNAKKALLEDETKRPQKAQVAVAQPDRDGVQREEADKADTIADDTTQAAYQQSMINNLASLILGLLQQMNNGGGEGEGENNQGNIGASANTDILNNRAICLTNNLLESIDALSNIAWDEAVAAGDEVGRQASSGEGGADGFLSALGMVAGLAGQLLNFAEKEKFTEYPQVFHAAGNGTQDQRQQGCLQERIYQTNQGFLPSLPSIGAGAGGFGAAAGLAAAAFAGGSAGGNGDGRGFGGLSSDLNPVVNVIPCEDATTQFFPDDYDDPRFTPNTGESLIFEESDPNQPGAIQACTITGPRLSPTGDRCFFDAFVTLTDERFSPETTYEWSVQPPQTIIGGDGPRIEVDFDAPGKYAVCVSATNAKAKAAAKRCFNIEIRNLQDMPADGIPETILPGINTFPNGQFAVIEALSLPSSEPEAAKNFVQGIPNVAVVIKPGKQYYFRNEANPKYVFPSVFIQAYAGAPIPVIDQKTGEFVALLTSAVSWSDDFPQVPITVIPDNNEIGILSQDPNFDIELGGFYIQNTGRGYRIPTINIIDKDTGLANGEVEPVVVDGRIVDINISDTGSGFKRIPEVEIIDNGKVKELKEIEKEMEARGLYSYIRAKGEKPQ